MNKTCQDLICVLVAMRYGGSDRDSFQESIMEEYHKMAEKHVLA